jgi:hypothetical protein
MVHDNNIATVGKIYETLSVIHSEMRRGYCVADSACSQAKFPFIIKSGNPTTGMTLNELAIQREASSMCQPAEWGIRAFQSSFSLIKDLIPFKERGEQKIDATALRRDKVSIDIDYEVDKVGGKDKIKIIVTF